MIRLITPTHRFILDVDPTEWDEWRITYKQNDHAVLEKNRREHLGNYGISGCRPVHDFIIKMKGDNDV